MLLVAVTTLVLCPAPQAPDAKPKANAVEATHVVEWSDKEAKAVVAKLKKATRSRKAKLADRVQAVNAVLEGRNKLLVKPLLRIIKSDPAVSVRKTAIQALGNQPQKQARPALLNQIRAGNRQPEITAALITALAGAGYVTRDWDEIDGLFAREFGEKYTQVQKAILQLVIKTEEKQAWRLLLQHLDEPIPSDVDGASNPPAEYWERRWKAWRVWRSDVKDALFAITGQRFSSSKEARIWIRANGAKNGLR